MRSNPVRAKLKEGKKTEADFAPELKAFDDLLVILFSHLDRVLDGPLCLALE